MRGTQYRRASAGDRNRRRGAALLALTLAALAAVVFAAPASATVTVTDAAAFVISVDAADNVTVTCAALARRTDGSTGVVWNEEEILEHFPQLRERMNVAADYLSGGEQQMVAVARALSGNVTLLLLDEPFEGLAPAVVIELFKVFDRLRSQISILIVEHNLDLVLALADWVFALERGDVFHEGPAAVLLSDIAYRKKILWL